jgi:hypothetical protein
MDRGEIENDLPLIEFYFDGVMRRLEPHRTKNARKVSRRELILTYMRTRDPRETARIHSVSVSLVYQLMGKAVYAARRCAGLWPGPNGQDE